MIASLEQTPPVRRGTIRETALSGPTIRELVLAGPSIREVAL